MSMIGVFAARDVERVIHDLCSKCNSSKKFKIDAADVLAGLTMYPHLSDASDKSIDELYKLHQVSIEMSDYLKEHNIEEVSITEDTAPVLNADDRPEIIETRKYRFNDLDIIITFSLYVDTFKIHDIKIEYDVKPQTNSIKHMLLDFCNINPLGCTYADYDWPLPFVLDLKSSMFRSFPAHLNDLEIKLGFLKSHMKQYGDIIQALNNFFQYAPEFVYKFNKARGYTIHDAFVAASSELYKYHKNTKYMVFSGGNPQLPEFKYAIKPNIDSIGAGCEAEVESEAAEDYDGCMLNMEPTQSTNVYGLPDVDLIKYELNGDVYTFIYAIKHKQGQTKTMSDTIVEMYQNKDTGVIHGLSIDTPAAYKINYNTTSGVGYPTSFGISYAFSSMDDDAHNALRQDVNVLNSLFYSSPHQQLYDSSNETPISKIRQ